MVRGRRFSTEEFIEISKIDDRQYTSKHCHFYSNKYKSLLLEAKDNLI